MDNAKRARLVVLLDDEDDERKQSAVVDVIFPKSEFEYDYSREKLITSDAGLVIRGLLQERKSLPAAAATTTTTEEEEEEEELAPMALPKAAKSPTPPTPSASGTPATPGASSTAEKLSEKAAAKAQNFSLKEWVDASPAPPPASSSSKTSSSSSATTVYTTPFITLHNEIISYRNFVTPSQQELDARAEVVQRVRDVAQQLWPKSVTEVFGSFATGLCLPDSDVDISVFNAPRNAIQQLAREFSTRHMCEWMEVIGKAKVPIIKLQFKGLKYPCDVCFDQQGGLQTAKLIQRVCQELPEVKCLVLVIKHFLAQRNLNNTYQGGMGSYLCFLTCVALVQRCRKQYSADRLNLGFILLEYFNFYGNVLDVERVGISLLDGGTFFLKSQRGFDNGERPHLLCMEDPVNPENDVGRNSRSMGMIRRAFGLAHTELKTKLEKTKDGISTGKIVFGVAAANNNNMILTCVIRVNSSNNGNSNSKVIELDDSSSSEDSGMLISDEEEDESEDDDDL